jgi:transposase
MPLIAYDKKAYRERNLIELMFGRLRDFRRVATPYNKLARNFLATTLLARSQPGGSIESGP